VNSINHDDAVPGTLCEAVNSLDKDYFVSDAKELARRVRAAAQHIPVGGSISIRGSCPISGFNLAEHVARLIENLGCERDIYSYLCDEPAKFVERTP
jgi:hypothetical protein